MNLNKLQTILELATAELNDVARADQEQRMTAHARLGDALEAARRIGLPPGVDWCPERDGVDALAWCAERWRDAAQRPPEAACNASLESRFGPHAHLAPWTTNVKSKDGRGFVSAVWWAVFRTRVDKWGNVQTEPVRIKKADGRTWFLAGPTQADAMAKLDEYEQLGSPNVMPWSASNGPAPDTVDSGRVQS